MILDWLGYIVIALLAIASAATIMYIGKPRKPMTGGIALVGIVMNVFMVVVILNLVWRS